MLAYGTHEDQRQCSLHQTRSDLHLPFDAASSLAARVAVSQQPFAAAVAGIELALEPVPKQLNPHEHA